MSELNALLPPPVTVEVAGVVIEVRELTVGQLPRFLAAAGPLLGALDGLDLALVAGNVGAVIHAVEIATSVERAWLHQLPARELLKLVNAVIEANADFFGVALPAFMRGLVARASPVAGSTTSNG
jgi:hypothetical protein